MINTSEKNNKSVLYSLISKLLESKYREYALFSLSKERESHPELGYIIWNSIGMMSCLLNEITSIYPLLHRSKVLTSKQYNRCCNALTLFQCVASHNETRELFLKAQIPLFLYPFLNIKYQTKSFEYLRLTSLGVLGALVKRQKLFLFV